ncbi:hypothetical protein HDR63_01235 [bacterium]|nr:hypothetical protein [bacterium]
MQLKSATDTAKLNQILTAIDVLKKEIAAAMKYKEQLNGGHTLSNNLSDRGFILNELDVTDARIDQMLAMLRQAVVQGEQILKAQKQIKSVRAQRATMDAMLRAFDEQAAAGVSYDAGLNAAVLARWMGGYRGARR